MARGQSQVQRLIPYQLELYEAQMKNSHARGMSALNGTINAIEDNNSQRAIFEKNNLSIQITAASGTVHDKKFEGQHKEVMAKLKNEFEQSLKP